MHVLWWIGWTILTVGAIGNCAAAYMEYRSKEPIYLTLMKIFSLCFGIGGVLIGLSAKLGV